MISEWSRIRSYYKLDTRWALSNWILLFCSSSIGTATLVRYGLLNYRWVFSAGMFLQSAVASGTSNPQLGGPVIRTFQLPPPGVPHVWNDASEPQQRKVELWARNFREFCRKWRIPPQFWILLHAINLRHGTDGFNSPPKDFFARKIRRLRPGLNPRTGVPKTSTLTSGPPKSLFSLSLSLSLCYKHIIFLSLKGFYVWNSVG